MKQITTLAILLLMLVGSGCELFEKAGDDPNVLGGTPDESLTAVGTSYTVYFTKNKITEGLEIDTAYITKSSNGVATVRIKADIQKVDSNIRKLIPAERLDANGNVDTEIKFKVTTEGIQDYYYSNGDESKPFTIVKHDMKVGTKWSFKTPSGKVVEREVTEKTGQDDWPFGFMFIKTTETTEHNPDVPGVVQTKFRTNHRFGLVHIQYIFATGDTVRLGIY